MQYLLRPLFSVISLAVWKISQVITPFLEQY